MDKNINVETNVKKVMGIILDVNPESIDMDSSQDNIENWDSIRHLNLILALEEEFGFTIPDDEAADLTSFQLINLVVTDLLNSK